MGKNVWDIGLVRCVCVSPVHTLHPFDVRCQGIRASFGGVKPPTLVRFISQIEFSPGFCYPEYIKMNCRSKFGLIKIIPHHRCRSPSPFGAEAITVGVWGVAMGLLLVNVEHFDTNSRVYFHDDDGFGAGWWWWWRWWLYIQHQYTLTQEAMSNPGRKGAWCMDEKGCRKNGHTVSNLLFTGRRVSVGAPIPCFPGKVGKRLCVYVL